MCEYLSEGQPQERSPKSSLEVIRRPIALLKPDPVNARVHSKKQIRQIARSIETSGFNVPVLVDADLKVIAGNGRSLAARELGLTGLPTSGTEHLSADQ